MTFLEILGLIFGFGVATAAAQLTVFYVQRAQRVKDEKKQLEEVKKAWTEQVEHVQDFLARITGKKPPAPQICPSCKAENSLVELSAADGRQVHACVSCGHKFQVR